MNDITKAMLLSQIRKVEPGTVQPNPAVKPEKSSQGPSFDKLLGQSDVQFSKHAAKRIEARSLEISEVERSKLEQAVGALEKKGAKDSLVLMGELAFIVNVPSKTVVTALSKDQMKEQVFTNIDSTILV